MQYQTDGTAAEAADYTRTTASLRGRLDDATWEAAWAEGRAMSLEQAITCALEET